MSISPRAEPNSYPISGTKMQAMAWTLATPFVADHVSLLITLPENRHQYLEIKIQQRFSLADAIVLVHFLGIAKAAEFVRMVDPWRHIVEKIESTTPGPV